MKKAFTLIELIFVIVILGILAGVAIPKLFPAINDSKVKKLQSEVSAIRVAIGNKYSTNIISGNNECPQLEKDNTDNKLFENILTYPIYKNQNDVKWDGNGSDYNATIGDMVVKFEYNISDTANNCKFKCKSVEGSSDYSCENF